jgi:trimeric autotransporter adhesin
MKQSFLKLMTLTGMVVATAGHAAGQGCEPRWLAQGTLEGTNGPINATAMWDPDGSGPRTPVLVLGGAFSLAGPLVATNIAAYDPATGAWSAFGAGTTRPVIGLTVTSTGDLIAAAQSTVPGEVLRWDGASWVQMGSRFLQPISTIAAGVNGEIFVGGASGLHQDGGSVASIVRWDGVTWRAVPGTPLISTRSIKADAQGNLLVVGTSFFLEPLRSVFRLTASGWSGIGAGPNGIYGQVVSAAEQLPNGDIIVAGEFSDPSRGLTNVARWDGTDWRPVGQTINGAPRALLALPDGRVVLGGNFLSAAVRNLALLEGSTWVPIGGETGTVNTLMAWPSGGFVVAGNFRLVGGLRANGVGLWDGTNWSLPATRGLTPLPDAHVNSLALAPNGEVIAVGAFARIGSAPINGVARRGPGGWTQVGPGAGGVNEAVVLPNGDVVIAGSFTSTPSGPANRIARWDGTAWVPLGEGLDGIVEVLAVGANGILYAGGSFRNAGGVPANRIAAWNGQSWSALGAGTSNSVFSMFPQADGSILVGGSFNMAGTIPANRIARWDGTTWSTFGNGVEGTVNAITQRPDGQIFIGGQFTASGFTTLNGMARWDGTTWRPVGNGFNNIVSALGVLANGDVVAGGAFTRSGTTTINRIARWDGTQWQPLGEGVGDGGVTALLRLPNGDLMTGGSFTASGGRVAQFLNTWGCPPCPADFDGNGTLDFFDYLDFVAAFAAGESRADFDGNGTVDFFDYLDFAAAFDAGC